MHPTRNAANGQALGEVVSKVATIVAKHVIFVPLIFLAQVSQNIHDQVLRQLRVSKQNRLPEAMLMVIPWQIPSYASLPIPTEAVGPFHAIDLNACVEGTTKSNL